LFYTRWRCLHVTSHALNPFIMDMFELEICIYQTCQKGRAINFQPCYCLQT
jgi:hypothetical protein